MAKITFKLLILIISLLFITNSNETDNIFEFLEDNSETISNNLTEGEEPECLKTNLENKSTLSNREKFILGKCNPVILVPGLLATRLTVKIDCPKIVNNAEKMEEINYFCGEYSICKKSIFGFYNIEEYTLWPSLFNTPFKMQQDAHNPQNLCLGYFFKYFNSKDECFNDKENIESETCLYDEAITVSFFGDTKKTEKDSKCGLKAISKIADAGFSILDEDLVNSSSSKGFFGIVETLKQLGYEPGFNLAGIPYDFRRFVRTNKEFKDNLLKMLKYLNENTGKKVIIISHSYGSLNTYDNVNKHNNEYTDLIKNWISIGAPFGGSPKAIETMIKPTKEFYIPLLRNLFVDISNASQKLFFRYMPTTYELMLNPYLHHLQNDDKYHEFITALNERIKLEKNCPILGECSKEALAKDSLHFSRLFPFLPSYKDEICLNYKQDIESMKRTKYDIYSKQLKDDYYWIVPEYLRCNYKLFDYLKCPIVVTEPMIKINNNNNNNSNNNNNKEINYFTDSCIKDERNIIKNSKNWFNFNCKNLKNCYQSFLSQQLEYGLDKEIEDIVKKPIPSKLKENTNLMNSKIKAMINKHNSLYENDEILPVPLIPITIIYSTFIKTRSAYYFNKDSQSTPFVSDDIAYSGGDGTVNTYSSFIPGLKWIYDNYKKVKFS